MADYVAVELITKQDGTFMVNTFKKTSKDDAESAYHSILTSAAKSPHAIHAATILNPEGQKIKSECYKHAAPAPEPDPEEDDTSSVAEATPSPQGEGLDSGAAEPSDQGEGLEGNAE